MLGTYYSFFTLSQGVSLMKQGIFSAADRPRLWVSAMILIYATNFAYATQTTIDVSEDTEITNWSSWINDARGEITTTSHPYYGQQLRVSNDNFPTGAYAGTGNNSELLLRWDLSSIPATDVITSVTLRMIQFDGSTSTTNVYGIDQGVWTEAGTSWNSWNAQTTSDTFLGSFVAAPYSVNGGESLFSSAALTSLVQAWHDGSQSNLGLLMRWGGPNSDGDTFASRESTTDDAPMLIIEHQAVPEPGTTLLALAGALTFAGIRRRSQRSR